MTASTETRPASDRKPRVRPADLARAVADAGAERLAGLILEHAPVSLLCGAGCSTASGIPDYRDNNGSWKQRQPMLYQEFMSGDGARRRYWARSMIGWPRFSSAEPNATHHALAELERRGYVHTLITQNVDNLHRRAGQRKVIDLHGNLAEVVCTDCGAISPRDALQQRLVRLNRRFHRDMERGAAAGVASAADGDAMLERGYDDFSLASCARCGGVLKPNVVFFGESVPRPRVELAFRAVAESGLLLIVGSSLMVYSGYRFCRAAREGGIPVAIVNRGRTRGDEDAVLKISADCGEVLHAVLDRLPPS